MVGISTNKVFFTLRFQPIGFQRGGGNSANQISLARNSAQEGYFWSGFRPIRFFHIAVSTNRISGGGTIQPIRFLWPVIQSQEGYFWPRFRPITFFDIAVSTNRISGGGDHSANHIFLARNSVQEGYFRPGFRPITFFSHCSFNQ